jgi:hypothetical protein
LQAAVMPQLKHPAGKHTDVGLTHLKIKLIINQ